MSSSRRPDLAMGPAVPSSQAPKNSIGHFKAVGLVECQDRFVVWIDPRSARGKIRSAPSMKAASVPALAQQGAHPLVTPMPLFCPAGFKHRHRDVCAFDCFVRDPTTKAGELLHTTTQAQSPQTLVHGDPSTVDSVLADLSCL